MQIKVSTVRDENTDEHLGYEIEIDGEQFFQLNPKLNGLPGLRCGTIVPSFGQVVEKKLLFEDEEE